MDHVGSGVAEEDDSGLLPSECESEEADAAMVLAAAAALPTKADGAGAALQLFVSLGAPRGCDWSGQHDGHGGVLATKGLQHPPGSQL